jgi:hypothetical protein
MPTPEIVTSWRKAARSENQGACVEVAFAVTADAEEPAQA